MSIIPASALSHSELASLGNNVLPAVLRDRTSRPRTRDFRHPRSARRPRWAWHRRRPGHTAA